MQQATIERAAGVQTCVQMKEVHFLKSMQARHTHPPMHAPLITFHHPMCAPYWQALADATDRIDHLREQTLAAHEVASARWQEEAAQRALLLKLAEVIQFPTSPAPFTPSLFPSKEVPE